MSRRFHRRFDDAALRCWTECNRMRCIFRRINFKSETDKLHRDERFREIDGSHPRKTDGEWRACGTADAHELIADGLKAYRINPRLRRRDGIGPNMLCTSARGLRAPVRLLLLTCPFVINLSRMLSHQYCRVPGIARVKVVAGHRASRIED